MPHAIFQRFPLDAAKVPTSAGQQPNPYHVYEAHAVWIGGTADLDKVKALLGDEHVTPAQTKSGKALMAVWAVDEASASHGPHTELQFSIYVTHAGTQAPQMDDSPLALLPFLLTVKGARQLCHGLWNNTPEVVAYNHEVLGLTPHLSASKFSSGSGRFAFEFRDARSGELVARGDVRDPGRNSLGATMALFRALGFRGALRAATMKEIETIVVNPINDVLPRNADARTVAAPAKVSAHLFDATSSAPDHLDIQHPVYGALGFEPSFVQHMTGFKMVYLNPA